MQSQRALQPPMALRHAHDEPLIQHARRQHADAQKDRARLHDQRRVRHAAQQELAEGWQQLRRVGLREGDLEGEGREAGGEGGDGGGLARGPRQAGDGDAPKEVDEHGRDEDPEERRVRGQEGAGDVGRAEVLVARLRPAAREAEEGEEEEEEEGLRGRGLGGGGEAVRGVGVSVLWFQGTARLRGVQGGYGG